MSQKLVFAALFLLMLATVGYTQQDTLYAPGQALIKTSLALQIVSKPGGIVFTGETWFDELSIKYGISDITPIFTSPNQNFDTYYKVVFPITTDVMAVCADFKTKQTEVVYAEPNFIFHTVAVPDDPNFYQQWALVKIQAPEAWDINTGDDAVVISIIDTGTDLTHPDLMANLWNGNINHGYNVLDPGNPPMDDNGHGTHCAGIAGAITDNGASINGKGIAGLAGGWGTTTGVRIMSIKSLNRTGSGVTSDLFDGIIWAADNGANVISMSWGGWSATPGPQILHDAIIYAHNTRGCILIAAAGNDNRTIGLTINDRCYPAYWDECISVAASDINDKKAPYSNFGDWVDVTAPGGYKVNSVSDRILSTLPSYSDFYLHNDPYGYSMDYDFLNGTSMAAPYVSGLAGLILSQYPTLTNQQVRERILGSVDLVNGIQEPEMRDSIGFGRINAYKALTMTESPVICYRNHATTNTANDQDAATGTNEMSITLKNIWANTTNNVTAVLETTDPFVSLPAQEKDFGQMNKYQAFSNITDPYSFSVSQDCPIYHKIKFQIGIYLSSNHTNGFDQTDSFYVNVGFKGLAGFPLSLGTDIHSSPAVFDIEGDGFKEFAIGCDDHKMYAFRLDGSIAWSFTTNGAIWSSPLAIDLNNDGLKEIVFGSDDGFIYALTSHGALLWQYQTGGKVQSSPAGADIDGDRKTEIVVGSYDNKVYCLSNTGNLKWAYTSPRSILATPAIGDLDWDGNLEIVGNDIGGYIFALHGNGSLFWANQLAEPQYAGYSYTTHNSPSLCDMDHDGYLDIVWNYDALLTPVARPEQHTGLICYKYNGQKMFETNIMTNIAYIGAINIKQGGSPIIGDLNADGQPEIAQQCGSYYVVKGGVPSTESLYIFNTQGDIYKTISIPLPSDDAQLLMSSPIIWDLPLYGGEEILHTNSMLTYIANNGNTAAQTKVGSTVYYNNTASPIEIVNSDGSRYIVAVMGESKIYLLAANAVDNYYHPWAMFRHDERRTGNFMTGRPPAVISQAGTAYQHNRKLARQEGSETIWATYESTGDIYLTKSTDDGLNWYLPFKIGAGECPAISLDQTGHPNLAWRSGSLIEYVRIASTPPPDTIGMPVIEVTAPSIAVYNNTVFVAYGYFNQHPHTQGTLKVMSFPAGQPENAVTYDVAGNIYDYPSIAVDETGVPHVSYEGSDHEIYYTYLNGASWVSPQNISNTPSKVSRQPSLSINGDRATIVWSEETGSNVFDVKKRTKLIGMKWLNPTLVGDAGDIAYPQSDPLGFITYQKRTGANNDVYLYNPFYGIDNTSQSLQNSIYPQVITRKVDDPHTLLSTYYINTMWQEGDINPFMLNFTRQAYGGATTPKYDLLVGDTLSTPYTLHRDGFIVYGDQPYQSVDFATTELTYEFTTLKPDKQYSVMLVSYHESSGEWKQKLKLDGRQAKQIRYEANQPDTTIIVVPKPYCSDGRLTLSITREKGTYAAVAGIKLFEHTENGSKGDPNLTDVATSLPISYVFQLSQNAPNPSSGATSIHYQIAEPSHVRLTVYNTLGQVVRTLVDDQRNPGIYNANWDNRNESGQMVSCGVYLYRLTAGKNHDIRKMVVIK